MPEETKEAIEWSLGQKYIDGFGNECTITTTDSSMLVTKVREYFNAHNIEYNTFSYNDLKPFLHG